MGKTKFILLMFTLFLSLSSTNAWSDIIIDNTDSGFELVGGQIYWGTASNPPYSAYGNDARYARTGNQSIKAVYTFNMPDSGVYDVYAWWPSHSVCSTDTPYNLSFSDEDITVRVNQQQNGGQWNFLASGYYEEGTHQIDISTDADGQIVVADAVMISSLNHTPALDPIENFYIYEGEVLVFSVNALDIDNDNLSYSAENLPPGATFDPISQIFSWDTMTGDVGVYTVTFQVVDDGTPSLNDSQDVTITVGDVEFPPTIDPIGNQTVNEGELLEFIVSADDPDGDSLIYSVSNLPEGATFNPETSTFSWIPGWQSSGEYGNIIFSASDGLYTSEEIIKIDVIDTSPLPAPTGLAANRSDNAIHLDWDNIGQAELQGYNIYRSTTNPGNYIKLNNVPVAISQYTDQDVEFGATYYYFVTAVDTFEQRELFVDGLSFPFNLTFDDEGRLFVGSWIDGVVWRIDQNGNSTIYASNLGTVACLAFRGGNLYITNYDGGPVQMITPDGEAHFFAPSLSLEYPTGLAFNSSGELFVGEDLDGNIFKISENGGSWNLFAHGLDGPGAMLINNSGDLIATEDLWIDGIMVGAIDRIDPSGNLTVLANLPDPDGITVDQAGNYYIGQSDYEKISKIMPDGSTRTVAGNLAPWGVGINKFNELLVILPWDDQVIKIHLSHESEISNKESITFTSSNNAPILAPIGDKTINEGEPLTFTVSASDPDGDNLTFSATNLPPGATFNPGTRVFNWTPGHNQAGSYPNIQFMVIDDGSPSLSDSEPIAITVNNVNQPPTAIAVGNPTKGTAPLTVSFTGSNSFDDDGTVASYAWDFGDGNGSSQPDSTHTYQNAGTYTAVLTVTDNDKATDTAMVEITVTGTTPVYVMHVNAIEVTKQTLWILRSGTSRVQVVDNDGSPVDNATITGQWSGGASDIDQLVTGPDGWASTSSNWRWGDATFTFCVTNISKEGWEYDPDSNEISCQSNN